MQLLLCGVDTCLEQGSSHQEIAAVLQALARRGVAQALVPPPPVSRPLSLLAPHLPPHAENGYIDAAGVCSRTVGCWPAPTMRG
ncbi:two-component response regulator [Bordetella hinzii]|uniref:hypothetical protein n=1 Tax=Bordetella hinzii TaxID=103855 RepID=UPI00040365C0|nr:hypothetical protein [Bordetella hinzii]AKQ57307.1 hypothetical protein ACR54_04027 [Bordetella hinzii]SNV63891.1 two-component response regulator [Bordetella hinzii]